MHSCQKNPKKSYTEKKLCINLIVIQCSYIVHLMQQKISFIVIEVQIVWKDFVKTWQATEIINYEKKETIPLTNEENRSY